MNGPFRTSINSSRRKYNSSSHCLYKENRADQQCSNRRRSLKSTRVGRWVPDKDNVGRMRCVEEKDDRFAIDAFQGISGISWWRFPFVAREEEEEDKVCILFIVI